MAESDSVTQLWSEADVQQLTKVLQQLLAVYRKVLSACEQNKDGLVDNDAAKMESALSQLEQYFEIVNGLEAQRQQVLNGMASNSNIDESELTVSYLTAHLPESMGTRIESVSEELKRVFEQIARINALNEELVGQSIGYFNKTLDLVSSAMGDSNYGETKHKNRAAGRLFDGQA